MAEIRTFLNILAVVTIASWVVLAVAVTIYNRTRGLLEPAYNVNFGHFVAAVVAACWLCAGVLHG